MNPLQQIANAPAAEGEDFPLPRWLRRLLGMDTGPRVIIGEPGMPATPGPSETSRMENEGTTLERHMTQFKGSGLRYYINPLLARYVYPGSYPVAIRHGQDLSVLDLLRAMLDEGIMQLDRPERDPGSEDAWRMYLGQPQTQGTHEVSPYRPSERSEAEGIYYRVPGLLQNLIKANESYGRSFGQMIQDIRSSPGQRLRQNADYIGDAQGRPIGSLRNVTLGHGEDDSGPYISLYDIYDLDVATERGGHGFGTPFEIYDRLYYDPRTLQPKNIDATANHAVGGQGARLSVD